MQDIYFSLKNLQFFEFFPNQINDFVENIGKVSSVPGNSAYQAWGQVL